MTWTFTADLDAYAAAVTPLLERDPARNTVALSALDRLPRGGRFSEVAPTFGWLREAGEVTGAVFLTPPRCSPGWLDRDARARARARRRARARARNQGERRV